MFSTPSTFTPASPIIPSSLVQEDHGLSQVGSSLDDVDDAFRADPRQLFGLGLVEQVVQVAQRLLEFQALAGQSPALGWVEAGGTRWNPHPAGRDGDPPQPSGNETR